MVKVENKETLRLLADRFMKKNRARNRILVIAIALTSLLFTSLFMGSLSIILSRRQTEIKQFMDSAHATAQNLTAQEEKALLQAIEEEKEVERYGTGIFLGPVLDERLGYSTELRYGDANLAESFQCLPTRGRMPERSNEIAVSSLVLDAFGLPHETGTEITLCWEVSPDGKRQIDDFQVCGFWEGDKAVLSQLAWVSEEYAKSCGYPVSEQELKDGIYNGGRDVCVWYKSLWKLNKTTESLAKSAGFQADREGLTVNPAYDLMGEDAFSFSSVAVMLLFIVLAGYLIIYNIFNISVQTDIRDYGLLKNVGTTGKQLKKLVRMQAWRLSVRGIPLGLILGYLAGVVMAPSLTADAQISAQADAATQTVVSAPPAVFLLSALLTLFTVYLSSFQACHMVEKVSPVEALRMQEGEPVRKKRKKNGPVTWWGMAVGNLRRNWKKGVVVMLSIALSLVVVDGIVMLVKGYDFDAYKKIFLAADFQIDQLSGAKSTSRLQGITPEVKEMLEACPDSESTGYVYYSDETHAMEPTLRKTWEGFAKTYEAYWSDYEKGLWESAKENNRISVHFLGISQSVFEKLEWKDAPCSWEEFQTGRFVLVDYNNRYSEQPVSYYEPGEPFVMTYQSGEARTYEVLGEALMPYSLDYPFADIFFITVMAPEKEYIARTGNDNAMLAAVDAKKGQDK
ncbi:MAG: ABC transporter permease, partial [Eubacteriales bacterium]|nr:ABC transporter permease [Eubacteriales bacterium]